MMSVPDFHVTIICLEMSFSPQRVLFRSFNSENRILQETGLLDGCKGVRYSAGRLDKQKHQSKIICTLTNCVHCQTPCATDSSICVLVGTITFNLNVTERCCFSTKHKKVECKSGKNLHRVIKTKEKKSFVK